MSIIYNEGIVPHVEDEDNRVEIKMIVVFVVEVLVKIDLLLYGIRIVLQEVNIKNIFRINLNMNVLHVKILVD